MPSQPAAFAFDNMYATLVSKLKRLTHDNEMQAESRNKVRMNLLTVNRAIETALTV